MNNAVLGLCNRRGCKRQASVMHPIFGLAVCGYHAGNPRRRAYNDGRGGVYAMVQEGKTERGSASGSIVEGRGSHRRSQPWRVYAPEENGPVIVRKLEAHA